MCVVGLGSSNARCRGGEGERESYMNALSVRRSSSLPLAPPPTALGSCAFLPALRSAAAICMARVAAVCMVGAAAVQRVGESEGRGSVGWNGHGEEERESRGDWARTNSRGRRRSVDRGLRCLLRRADTGARCDVSGNVGRQEVGNADSPPFA